MAIVADKGGGSPVTDLPSTNRVLASGVFSAAGSSSTFYPKANCSFDIELSGTFVATVQLYKSTDGGANFFPVTVNAAASLTTWSVPVSESWVEGRDRVAYRLVCTAYTSGSVVYRVAS